MLQAFYRVSHADAVATFPDEGFYEATGESVTEVTRIRRDLAFMFPHENPTTERTPTLSARLSALGRDPRLMTHSEMLLVVEGWRGWRQRDLALARNGNRHDLTGEFRNFL